MAIALNYYGPGGHFSINVMSYNKYKLFVGIMFWKSGSVSTKGIPVMVNWQNSICI